MTDRINSLTVVLTTDIRTDDAEEIINAIKMVKGVIKVTPLVAQIEDHIAYTRARRDLVEKLWHVLHDPDNKK